MYNTQRILWKISSKYKETEEPVWSKASKNDLSITRRSLEYYKNNTQSIIVNNSSKKGPDGRTSTYGADHKKYLKYYSQFLKY